MQVIFIISSLVAFLYISDVTSFPTTNSATVSSRGLPLSPTVLHISKRGALSDEKTGLLNQKTLDAHLRYILRKQVVGAMNYYKITGNVLPTFNMTPYQLEEMYHSGSVSLNETGKAPQAANSSGQILTSLKNVESKIIGGKTSRIMEGTTVPLNNLGGKDLIWAATIQVGSPPKSFLVSVDTGSSDFFLASNKCPTSQCAKKNIYVPQQSSTSKHLNNSYTISFGDGSSVKAEVMRDTVTMGGVSLPNIGVGAVTQLSAQFQSSTGDTSDGLIGLGFPSLSQSKTEPFFTALTKSNKNNGIIGARFSRKSEEGSEITIGGVNKAAFRGYFTTMNVMAMVGQPPGFWDITFDGAIVNGQRLRLNSTIATIDTGTSILGVPQEDARAIYASVPGAISTGKGQYSFPCNSLPSVSVIFGGRNFKINPLDMTIGKDKNGLCVGGIIGLDKKGVWLVGQVFLKNVYSVYDHSNYTVSFADLS